MNKEQAIEVLEKRTHELMGISNIGSLKHANIVVVFDDMLNAIKVLKKCEQ
jgi:hypothetical protein